MASAVVLCAFTIYALGIISKTGSLAPVGRPRNPRIQGLRGVAMSLVALMHLASALRVCFPPNSSARVAITALRAGQFGSGLFLAITGYVIYARCRDGGPFTWKSFLKARALRLIPLYWLLLTCHVVCDWVTGMPGKLPADPWVALRVVAENFVLIAPLTQGSTLITVAWTLTYVVIAYFTVPILAHWFTRRRIGATGRVSAILLFGLGWVVVPLLWPNIANNGLAIAVGMLVLEVSRTRPWTRIRMGRYDALTAAVAVCAVALLAFQSVGWAALAEPWAHLLRVLAVTLPPAMLLAGRVTTRGAFNRLLASPAGQWMGKISYSFYFAHGVALIATRDAVLVAKPWAAGWVPDIALFFSALAVAYCLSLAVGAAVHHWVERPLHWLLTGLPTPALAPVQVVASESRKRAVA